MSIYFEKSGLLTTVQDRGRYGYQSSGFSVSGVMDKRSAQLANVLVDNPINEAVFEFLLMGPTMKFNKSTYIAITGADFSPKLNGQEVPTYTAIHVHEGDVLEFGFAKNGLWGYVAVSSKLGVENIMGSHSTNLRCGIGGYNGRKIEAEDEISFREKTRQIPSLEKRHIEPEFFGDKDKTIRVIPCLQNDHFTEKGIQTFFNETYVTTEQSDRMGYRLDGPAIEHKDGGDIISDGIPLGAIQVPSHGKPIIMLSDRQTTGGYTKIGTVIGVDIPLLVQSQSGTRIHFKEITVEEAQDLYAEQFANYEKLSKELSKMSLFERIKNLFS